VTRVTTTQRLRDNSKGFSDHRGYRSGVFPAFRPPDATVRRRREALMAAMKPRTGDGPLEVTKEGRFIVMRVPIEGGGRLVVELQPDEARELGAQLVGVVGPLPAS
jgi:hypothetical protein